MTSVDGVVTPTEDAKVPVLDRGFLYGDSVYEVFRTYDGVPLFYDEHWERFRNSAAMIRLEIGLDKAEMTRRIRTVVAATGAARSRTDVYVRYTVTRGVGPIDLFPAETLTPSCVIIVNRAPAWRRELYDRGVRLVVPETRRNSGSALDPNIKGGNYLNNVLGLIEARALGADDCLMLNDAGLVTEASNSNVFFVIDGELVTPSQKARNLKGLTKAAVHEACRARGLPTFEREIGERDAARATECFLTSATREVMPVASLRLGDGREVVFPAGGGELTRRAARYYREHVAEYVARNRGLSLFE
ncbi:MAG TPA: aminotransferase class IV [Gammaproteobacteria bacterium]